MDRGRASAVAWGVVLILLGVLFLGFQMFGLPGWISPESSWPLIVIGVGLVFMTMAVVARTPGLAIPACIVGGIGVILYYQNLTGDWESWSYIWSLIPGFVGVGIILAGLLARKPGGSIVPGLWLVGISGLLFVVFGAFLGPFGRLAGLVRYWPVLLIIVGGLLLVKYAIRPTSRPPRE